MPVDNTGEFSVLLTVGIGFLAVHVDAAVHVGVEVEEDFRAGAAQKLAELVDLLRCVRVQAVGGPDSEETRGFVFSVDLRDCMGSCCAVLAAYGSVEFTGGLGGCMYGVGCVLAGCLSVGKGSITLQRFVPVVLLERQNGGTVLHCFVSTFVMRDGALSLASVGGQFQQKAQCSKRR